MKKEILIILLLLLISFPAVRSLLQPGGYTSHDLTHHVVRQIDMDRLLSEGQFPPRWSGELASGFGYPLFLFNYPLPAMLGEVFHKLGLGFVDSVKAVFFVSLLLSAACMYLFLKSLLKSYLASFLGAVFYLYAPIHLIVVYVSGAPGAALGLVFPPFIFWALHKGNILLGAISLAFLILSHNITAFIFTPILLIFGLFVARNIKATIIIFLLGLSLSAWFWLPALAEKQFIRYDELMKGIYLDQFPTLRQIIYSPWGYGLSHPQKPEPGDMSYQIGLAHILVISVLALFIKKPLVKFVLFGFILSIFFMLEISRPLWDSLPFLPYVQFPVRLLVVPVFSASLAASLLVKYLPFKKLLAFSLMFLVIYANRNHLNINQKFDPGESYYLLIKTSATSFDEDLPIWVRKIETKPSRGKVSFLSGAGEINILENKSNKVLAEIATNGKATLRFNQYYFPGWEIKVDGKKVDFNYTDTQSNGMPVFDIEKGKHTVLAEFRNTTIRNLADSISLIAVIIIIWRLLTPVLLKIKKYCCG